MNEKYLPYAYSFNEELLAYELIHLKSSEVITTINYNIRNSTFNLTLGLVARYLLHICHIEPIMVRQMIRRYAVIISYVYIDSIKGLDMRTLKNDKIELLINNMSVDKLKNFTNVNGLFGKLYNDIDYNDSLNKLYNKLANQGKDTEAKKVYKLLRGEYNYFSRNTNLCIFNSKDNMKRYDMIVAEEISHNTFKSFEFKILDYDNFKNNLFNEDLKDVNIRVASIWMGYFIDYLMSGNKIRNFTHHDVINNGLFVLACSNKSASVTKTRLMFLFDENNEKLDKPNLKKISYFKFMYNNKEYEFTSRWAKQFN